MFSKDTAGGYVKFMGSNYFETTMEFEFIQYNTTHIIVNIVIVFGFLFL